MDQKDNPATTLHYVSPSELKMLQRAPKVVAFPLAIRIMEGLLHDVTVLFASSFGGAPEPLRKEITEQFIATVQNQLTAGIAQVTKEITRLAEEAKLDREPTPEQEAISKEMAEALIARASKTLH